MRWQVAYNSTWEFCYFLFKKAGHRNRKASILERTRFEAELGVVACPHGQLSLSVESVVTVVVGRCTAVEAWDVARAIDTATVWRRRPRTSSMVCSGG